MAFIHRPTACRKKQPRPCSFCRLGIEICSFLCPCPDLNSFQFSLFKPIGAGTLPYQRSPPFHSLLQLSPSLFRHLSYLGGAFSFMRRLSSTRLPQLLNSARPPLSRPPRAAPLLSSRLLSVSASAPLSSFSPPRANRPSRRSPLSQSSKRYCSYRRMCGSRRAGVSGSTNVPDREVLPTNVKPTHYDLTLEPNFETFKYDGTVVIEYVALRPFHDRSQTGP